MEALKLTNEHLTRQLDIIPIASLGLPITIVGAGAIGSFACLQLVKMGFTNITVWDYDTVSIENMSCQFYRFKDIGKPKVEALRDLILDFTGITIKTMNGKYVPSPDQRGVLIMAADCMRTRKEVFEECRMQMFMVKHVIDTRMGSEFGLMYVMQPHDQRDAESYAKTLYSDADAVQERCTAKATIYTANLLSGMVCKAVKDIATDGKYPRITQWSIKNNQLLQWSKQ